jgi:hypothetical protein
VRRSLIDNKEEVEKWKISETIGTETEETREIEEAETEETEIEGTRGIEDRGRGRKTVGEVSCRRREETEVPFAFLFISIRYSLPNRTEPLLITS